MEDLKRKVKNLVPEHKHLEIDNIFREWIARLKAHVEGYEEPQWRKNEGSSRDRREHLQRQIERLTRPRTKVLRESDTSTTDLTLAEMEEDFGKVRDGILKIRLNLNKPKAKEGESENVELIRKLQEVKRFLEKLT